MNKITVIVVDDHPLFLQGVVDSLSLEEDIKVIGKAADGIEAYTMIKELKPNVVLLDVNLPGMNGQQVTRKVSQEKLYSKIIFVTAYDDLEQKIHAFRAGASAYCSKDIDPQDLSEIIRAVAENKYVIDDNTLNEEELIAWLDRMVDENQRTYSDPGEPFYPLSAREMEVLEHVTHGLSNKEIAVALGISHQTVKNHVTSILRKLNVDDRTQAAVYALRRGWVRLDTDGFDVQEQSL